MAGAPAYRFDYAGGSQAARAYPRPNVSQSPSVRVVPGRKNIVDPVLSDAWVTGIKVVIAVMFVLVLLRLLTAPHRLQVSFRLRLPMLVQRANLWLCKKASLQVRAIFVMLLKKS